MAKIVQHLNWNHDNYVDRENVVKSLESEGMFEGLSPYQLDDVANYLLYSKDVDCEVKLKVPSKKIVSYEELVETMAGEITISSAPKTQYKVSKPSIDKEKDADIPGMQDLWKEIEMIKNRYDYVREVLHGEREPDFERTEVVNHVTHNFFRTWYIDMCLQQYTLKDSYKPTIMCQPTKNFSLNADEVTVGFKVGDIIMHDSGRTIDLGEPDTIYKLLRNYVVIKELNMEKIDSDWTMLYNLLDEAIADINWSNWHWIVLQMKVLGYPNWRVLEELKKQCGLSCSVNYISTIYKQQLTRKIAKKLSVLAFAWENRDNKECFKECRKCGKQVLIHSDYFKRAQKTCLKCLGKKEGMGKTLDWNGVYLIDEQ